MLVTLLFPFTAISGDLEQAKRIHERLTGVQPSAEVLGTMLEEFTGIDGDDEGTQIGDGDGATSDGVGAAYVAMENDNFYRVTIKNWVAPWTNRDQSIFVPLNDYIATVMGYIHDELDFRGILFDDVIYHAPSITPAYNEENNDHYEALEATDPQLAGNSFAELLASSSQTPLTGVPTEGVAGVMTSRAAAEAFFVDGTNRAMLRYTLMNHMCVDLEQLQDATTPPDRVRQDVSRSPGGDSRVFSNTCVTCHGGMDPLAQAFAYYDFVNEDVAGQPSDLLVYTPAGIPTLDENYGVEINPAVNAKYHINEATFPFGYRTPDDRWDNYWLNGVNSFLGWGYGDATAGSGNGAKSLGEELANSKAFAQCQVRKVFRAVCLREPANSVDLTNFDTMTSNFKSSNYNLKNTFAEVANYCKGS